MCIATADDSQGPHILSDKQRDNDVMSALAV